MNHDALNELRNILKTRDWTEFCPERERARKFEQWCTRWITEVEFAQSVVSTKYLDSEYNDIIKTKLAQSLAEELTEDCISFKTQDKKITATMSAMRRRAKV